MKKIMSYILNPIKADKEGAAKMNTKIKKRQSELWES